MGKFEKRTISKPHLFQTTESEGSFSDRLKAAIQTATSAPVKSLDQALKEEADSNGSSESSHTEKNGEEEKDKKDEGEGEEEEEEGEDDGEKEEERDNSEEGEKEDIHNADERADIIELAWQWLDLSRLILTQTANLSNWEQLKEVHTLLAQISLESNNAAEALEDLNKALAIATENSKTPSYDRGVCETLFLTALAYALAGKYDDGISTLIEASSVLSRRIEKKTEQEEILKVDRSAISLDDQITDSISELKNLLIEITTKIEEFTKIALPIDDSDASSSSSQTTVSVFPSSSSQTTVSVSSSSSSSAPPSDGTSSKVRDFGLVGSRIGAKRERQDSPTEEPSKQAKSE